MSAQSKYQPEFGDIAIEFMAEGRSIAEYCAKIQVSSNTIRKWRDRNNTEYKESFAEKFEHALMLSEAWWTDLGRRAVLGEVKCHPTFWIFNMKNRFGWRDNSYVETKQESEIKISEMGESERKQRLLNIFKDNGLSIKDGKVEVAQ